MHNFFSFTLPNMVFDVEEREKKTKKRSFAKARQVKIIQFIGSRVRCRRMQTSIGCHIPRFVMYRRTFLPPRHPPSSYPMKVQKKQ